jgi:hypothetical protein
MTRHDPIYIQLEDLLVAWRWLDDVVSLSKMRFANVLATTMHPRSSLLVYVYPIAVSPEEYHCVTWYECAAVCLMEDNGK